MTKKYQNVEIPEPSNATRTYWEASIDEKLVIPYCNDCDEHFFYPRMHCPDCMSDNIDNREHSGGGELVSYTTIHRSPSSTYREIVPYINAIVELPEKGVRMMANIDVEDEDELEVGMPLEVTFAETDSKYKLPCFKPQER